MTQTVATIDVGGTGTTTGYYAFKNRIINGAMVIDQRDSGASVTLGAVNPQYTLDRWCFQTSQASKLSTQQNAGSITPPVGFNNYLGVTSLSSYSSGASDYFDVAQRIENVNTYDLAWGTANAKTVTLSFWVYSSLTGTHSGAINNNVGGGQSYVFTYSIPVANTWTQISITVQGSTGGSWSNSGASLYVLFNLGCGSSFLSSTTNSWVTTSGQLFGATGSQSVVGTNGATFYITGVQLEVGSSATSFDYRPYGTELALCQRYGLPFVPNTWLSGAYWGGGQTNLFGFPVVMRASPTLSGVTSWTIAGVTASASGVAVNTQASFAYITLSSANGLSNGQSFAIAPNQIGFLSSEL